jgi:iron complex transport system permease protein
MSVRGRRYLLVAILLGISGFALYALSVGSAEIDSPWKHIFSPSLQGASHDVIWDIRFPRVLAALLIGAALGVAGAISQAATNNPLADPSIIGTTAGASFGAAIAVILSIASIGTWPVTLFAFLGALFASLATFAASRSAIQLVIVGIATSALLSALVGLLLTIADRPDARSIAFWSLGSLALVSMSSISLLAPVVIVGVIVAWYISQRLDLLALGDAEVRFLGKNPQRMRLGAFLIISLLIATAVSTVGSIAFLALAAPHITRFLIGPSNRPLVIGSAVIGAGLLLIADTAARAIVPPFELPIGLITSLIGAPILILVLRRSSEVWR